jgi:hypothetical protein
MPSHDYEEFIAALNAHGVRYLVVGAHGEAAERMFASISTRKIMLFTFIGTTLTKTRSSMCSQIQERIAQVEKDHGWPLAKPEPDAIFGSFAYLILNPTAYL